VTYRYGLAFYNAEGDARVPVTGLKVLLVRPGSALASGLVCSETAPGYYEATVTDLAACGFYEVWDDQADPGNAARSGKHAILGPLDAAGLQDAANYLAQLATLKAAYDAGAKVHGCDIYIQDTPPATFDDYVWIDTLAVNFIQE
jgi:hypothetical protein